MSTPRRPLLIAGAVLALAASSGLVAAAHYAGDSVGSVFGEPATLEAQETARTIQILAGPLTLVCPAAPSLADQVVDVDDEFAQESQSPEEVISVASFPRGTQPAGEAREGLFGGPLERIPGGGESPHISWDTGLHDPLLLTAEPVGDETALASGTRTWVLPGGDLRSFVASPCLPGAGEMWLVGGSGVVGHSSVLELVNPTPTVATVAVELYGPLGRVDAPLLESITLAPGERESVRLEGSAAGVERLAARVTSSGADVVASVMDSGIDGLTPLGVDVVIPTLPPATSQLIPGVTLTAPLDDDGNQSPSGTTGASAVRVVNPGEEPTVVTLTLLGADGEVTIPGAENVMVDPGAVYDFSLAGLPAGDYAVQVEAALPVVVGAMLQRGSEEFDQTWIPAVGGAELLSGVVGGADRMLISAREDTRVTVTGWDSDGVLRSEETLPVEAGSTIAIPLESGGTEAPMGEPGGIHAVTVSSDAPVVGAAVYEALEGALFSVLPLTPDANDDHSLTLSVRN